jgi:ornithine cyclodeaminase
VIVLSEADVLARMSMQLVVDAVQQALIAAADGSGSANPVVIGRGFKQDETYSIKSGAAERCRVIGLKVGSYWPNNRAMGLAPHGSSILLLDPETGRLMAVVEASGLNGLRTAAADAVAADLLARADSNTLTLIGAGRQAECEARALCAIRPIQRVLIASRTHTRAQALSERIRVDLKLDAEVTDVEHGCREADILVTVTPSRSPLFESRWLKPGVHVASMGSDQVGKQELPPDLLRHSHLFCDSCSQTILIGEFQHIRDEVESGAISVTPIGAVLLGHAAGRRSPEEITVFDSSGLALQDLFVAASILRAGTPTYVP